MLLHEEKCGEIGHAHAFCRASGSPSEARKVMADVGVEALKFLGQRLSNEMFAFGKHAGVGGEIVCKSDPPFRLWKSDEKIFQVVGSASAHMNAEDAS